MCFGILYNLTTMCLGIGCFIMGLKIFYIIVSSTHLVVHRTIFFVGGAHRAAYPGVLDVPRYVFSVQLCGENPVVDPLMNHVTRVRAWSLHNNIITVEPRLD